MASAPPATTRCEGFTTTAPGGPAKASTRSCTRAARSCRCPWPCRVVTPSSSARRCLTGAPAAGRWRGSTAHGATAPRTLSNACTCTSSASRRSRTKLKRGWWSAYGSVLTETLGWRGACAKPSWSWCASSSCRLLIGDPTPMLIEGVNAIVSMAMP